MKNNKTIAPTPQELLADLRSLVAEAETLVAGSLREHSADALGNLRTRFNAAQEHCGELYSGAKKKVVDGARYTDVTIRENPYQSLLVVAGLGIVVGVLLGRRGK